MGKIDDIRRQREQQFAEQQRAAHVRKSTKGDAAKATEPNAVLDSTVDKIALPSAASTEKSESPEKSGKTEKTASRPSKLSAKPTAGGKAAAEVAEAKCPVCGKLRAVKNGVMAEHQKGLGKHCAGSRQKPK